MLEVKNLKKYFPLEMGSMKKLSRKEVEVVHAVDSVSFNVHEKEILGLAGESGCGKTTIAKLIVRLYEPTDGQIDFRGKDVFHLTKDETKWFRRNVQMIFQNPLSSLNPRKNIKQILSLPFIAHKTCGRDEVDGHVEELLQKVNLTPAREYMHRYPHQLSGGEKQRVGIARAISLKPTLIIADEPVASLDMSVRGMVLNLMKDLRENDNIGFFVIAHDLNVLRALCDKIAIMYLGKLVESAGADKLCAEPEHPYTKALLSAHPIANPSIRDKERVILKGDVPSPIDLPSGCRFHTRCPYKKQICIDEEPKLIKVNAEHVVACHLP